MRERVLVATAEFLQLLQVDAVALAPSICKLREFLLAYVPHVGLQSLIPRGTLTRFRDASGLDAAARGVHVDPG